MKGYLYQILIEGEVEALYWSIDSDLQDKIKLSYEDYFENTEFHLEPVKFEEWFNFNHVSQIERVFVDEIYV